MRSHGRAKGSQIQQLRLVDEARSRCIDYGAEGIKLCRMKIGWATEVQTGSQTQNVCRWIGNYVQRVDEDEAEMATNEREI
jgi:hypothetical protein